MEQISNLLDLVVSMNSDGGRGAKAVSADGLDSWREALGAARQAFRDAERAQSTDDLPDADHPVPVGFRQDDGPLETSLELPIQTGGPAIGPPLVLLNGEEIALEAGTTETVPVETIPTTRLPIPQLAAVEATDLPAESIDTQPTEPQPANGVALGSRDAQLDGVTVRTELPVAAEPSTSSTRAASPAPNPVPAQSQVPPQPQPQVELQTQPQPQPEVGTQPQPQVELQTQPQPQPQVEAHPQTQPQSPPRVEPQPQPQPQPAPTISSETATEPAPQAVAAAPSDVATTPNPVSEVAPPVTVETDSVPQSVPAPEPAAPATKPVETAHAEVTAEVADDTGTTKPAAPAETPPRPEPQATDGARSVAAGDEPVKEEPRVVMDEEVPEAIIDDSEPVNVDVRQPADPKDTETPAETPVIASAVDVRPRTVERRVDAGVARRSVGRTTQVDSTAASSEPSHVVRPEVGDRPPMVQHKSGVSIDDTEIKLPPADDADNSQPVDLEMTSTKQPAPSQNAAPELARAAVREYASASAVSDSMPAAEPTAPVSDSTVGGMQTDALDGAKPQQAAARVHHQALATAIAAKARAVPQDGSVELRFALEPEDLGAVRVRIESRGDQLKIKIIASSGAAVDSLSSGIGKLVSQLTEPGMKEPEIDLTFSDTAEHSEQSDRDGKGEMTQAGSSMSDTSGDLASTASPTTHDNSSGSTTQLDRMA